MKASWTARPAKRPWNVSRSAASARHRTLTRCSSSSPVMPRPIWRGRRSPSTVDTCAPAF